MNTIDPKVILNLALSIEDKGIGETVITYYGHTHNITISIYSPKWDEKKDNMIYFSSFYLEGELASFDKINKTLKALNEINDGVYQK